MNIAITLHGQVQRGKMLGRQLGFPTANITTCAHVPSGIYLSYAYVNSKQYPALTFIGIPETFNQKNYLAETHILRFSEDLYVKMLTIKLLQKIRESKKFATVEALVVQMQADKQQAEAFFQI